MTKYVQNFSTKLDKCLELVSDHVIIFLATAVFAVLAKSLGILP